MRRTARVRRTAGRTPTVPPGGLTVAQYAFALAYVGNGFNAAAAYRAAHPNVTNGTASVEGHRTLVNPKLRKHISERLDEHWKAEHMNGDEALARVAQDARADIRLLFDGQGELLKPHDWPDEIAGSVEALDVRTGKVKLASKTTARRIILEQTGKLKTGLTVGVRPCSIPRR